MNDGQYEVVAPETEIPDMTTIMRAIAELPTHEDFARLSEQMNTLHQHVEQIDLVIAELPAKYASAESVKTLTTSQNDYEASLRQLTKQGADMALILADNQEKFTSINNQLSDLSVMKTQVNTMLRDFTTLTGSMNTFMENQRERLDNQHERIMTTEKKAEQAAADIEIVKAAQQTAQLHNQPVHDFINGSTTQPPLKTVIDGIGTVQQTQGQQLNAIAAYVTAQQTAAAERRDFWRRVRLQMWTPRGVIALLICILVVFTAINAISFDQLIARIQQLWQVFQPVTAR